MAKGLIVYASRTGQTQKIGELIAEGMRFNGMEVEVKSATEIKKAEDLAGYDAYVFGSATYHGEMMESMKQLLFLAEKANLSGKCGGAFGAYGWSGEGSERVYNTMLHVLGLNMAGDCLRLKSSILEGGVPMSQGYGKAVAAKL